MMKTFMKKILLLLGSAAVFCAGMPFQVLAAEAGSEAAGAVPLALCIPFVGLLLCIAVRAVLCVRKYWNGRGFGRFPQNQCGTSDAGNLSV